MTARHYARVAGVTYIVVALLSFVPAFSTRPDALRPLELDVSYGLFAGLFPQNVVNKLALLLIGLAGFAVAEIEPRGAEPSLSVQYARAVFFVMGAAALLGVFPPTESFFGYWPLWGNEALLHGVNALVAGYFGFVLHARTATPERRGPLHAT